jgi:hypothetical protein
MVTIPASDLRAEVEKRLLRPAMPGGFTTSELDGLPEPVRRHLTQAIAPATPLATSARLRMRGHIKLGRWLPFRAHQVLNPHRGFVWAARTAGLISGSDRYLDRAGGQDWKLAGLVTVMHADGPDVSRAAAGRAGAEAIWVPTSLLPRFGVRWTTGGPDQVTAHYHLDEVPIQAHYRLDPDGRMRSFVFDRWGDPDESGTWAWHPFGGEITGWRTFEGVTIPSSGRVGWFFGTDRWPDGEFFRYQITNLHLVSATTTGADR